MPAKIMPGRKAGEDHAKSQCSLRQEAIRKPVRLRLASLAFGEASAASRAKNRCSLIKATLSVNGPPSSEIKSRSDAIKH